MVNVNENIRFLRKKKGWTQEKFSQKIGIKSVIDTPDACCKYM